MSGFWKHPTPLILASKSSIRYKMLADVGIDTEVVVAEIDERAIQLSKELPHNNALQLASAKARHVSIRKKDRLVLGVDQTLVQDETEFHKAFTLAAVKTKLLALSGKTHNLTSAAALFHNGEVVFSVSDEAHLTVRQLDSTFIDHYIDTAGVDILNAVGCYQIESHGAHLFDRIAGDQFTIMGLPLLKLLDAFRQQGLIVS